MSFRPTYHVAPPIGRLNDPNGMFIVDDELHLFYQHDPGFPAAPKRTGWAHTTVNLHRAQPPRHYPDALYPDRAYDAHGCYSGGAAHDGEHQWLFYTGNLKEAGENGRRIPSQNRVRVTTLGPHGGTFDRDPANPLIPDSEPGFTGHFRDPFILTDRYNTPGYRMFLGAQTDDHHGALVAYSSPDLQDWSFDGQIEFDGPTPGGYMWECPNIIRFGDTDGSGSVDAFIICPQFEERDECGYILGHLDGNRFHITHPYRLLDHGHAFYAPQLIPYRDGALMVGWMGLPGQDDVPTLGEGWAHTLTIPRYVTMRDGALVQTPLWEVPGALTVQLDTPATYVLAAQGEQCLQVRWDGSSLVVDRDGDVRRVACGGGELTLIADGCAVEVFSDSAAFSVPCFSPGGGRWDDWRRID